MPTSNRSDLPRPIFHKIRYANRTTGRSEAMSHSVARRCWSLVSATRRDVAFAHADSLNRKRNAADKREGQTREARHAGRNLHAPTRSGSASGQGSGQQLAVCPNHIADCEGVLDPNLTLRKTPRPVTHGQRAGTCHLLPVGRLAQMTN